MNGSTGKGTGDVLSVISLWQGWGGVRAMFIILSVLTVLQAYACIKMSQILCFKQYNLLYIKHTIIKSLSEF